MGKGPRVSHLCRRGARICKFGFEQLPAPRGGVVVAESDGVFQQAFGGVNARLIEILLQSRSWFPSTASGQATSPRTGLFDHKLKCLPARHFDELSVGSEHVEGLRRYCDTVS